MTRPDPHDAPVGYDLLGDDGEHIHTDDATPIDVAKALKEHLEPGATWCSKCGQPLMIGHNCCGGTHA